MTWRNRPMALLIGIVGLPGSGKTHYMKKLRTRKFGLVADDLMAGVPMDLPINRFPLFTDSVHYNRLIRALRAGKDCVVSDIIFCDTLARIDVERVLCADVPGLEIRWTYFRNDPRQCAKNVRMRKRASQGLELRLIRQLSQKYFPPQNAALLPVWKGSSRPAKPKRRGKARPKVKIPSRGPRAHKR